MIRTAGGFEVELVGKLFLELEDATRRPSRVALELRRVADGRVYPFRPDWLLVADGGRAEIDAAIKATPLVAVVQPEEVA